LEPLVGRHLALDPVVVARDREYVAPAYDKGQGAPREAACAPTTTNR